MAEMIQRMAFKLGLASLLVLAFTFPVGAVDQPLKPSDYKKILVEPGHRISSVMYAEGVQIYRWNGAAWAFVAPEAILYAGNDEEDDMIGIHYVGPTWESKDGSYVVGALVDKVTPDATAIPWLLLKAKTSEGPGVFGGVSYIQRLFTTGGLAPVEPGDFVGDEVHVPYTAWYVFYKKR